jgi:hypothetical protein
MKLSMKLGLRTVLLLISVSIWIELIVPCLYTKASMAIAQPANNASKVRLKNPPPLRPRGHGFPGNQKAAIARGDNCDSSAEELIALAPEFTQANEDSVWGQTTSAHPTIWFFMPYTDRTTNLKFSLQNDREDDLYTADIPAPKIPGIISVQIPASQQPLQVNQKYRWKLTAKIYCDKGISEKYVMGWVSRVNSSNADGIWYDNVTILAQQLLLDPNNVQLKQDWNDLLNSANLEKVAKQPLLR